MGSCFVGTSPIVLVGSRASYHPLQKRYQKTCYTKNLRSRLSMNVPGSGTGFVNCRRCGSDVVVEFSIFGADEVADVRCPECGRKWTADFVDVDVLFEGKIQKATELLVQKKTGNEQAAQVIGNYRRAIRIWVGNLPARIGDEDLRAMFDRYGDVTSARVIYDRNTSRSRGFGFVEMADEGEGRAAIQDLDGNYDLGRKIAVRQADAS
ncbi:hypothetical protein NDN08_003389 [Rhodosorus marinus]|uniref:RRM domain-containing protein n=1 Tax=Rhodosorus marinus TaxID=101924 RepID=A0AAV8UWC9_9RHOD|nr:hypothetical protein NDN08_003389 [Rhodosorus marinus]